MKQFIQMLKGVLPLFIITACITLNSFCQESSDSNLVNKLFQVSSPEQQGLDSKELIKMFDFIQENRINIHSLIIVRNGYLVLEAYFYPNRKGILHDLASVTKSMMSILTGIAIDKGYIKDVHQPVMDFFKDREIQNLNEAKKKLTIKNLLTMTTGFTTESGDELLDRMRDTDDWVQFVLDQPIVLNPGERFAYCSAGVHLLSGIISRATGLNALDFARRYLFDPLKIKDIAWSDDPQGNSWGWGDLHLHSIDMAKIGSLLLNEGIWEGKQIVPADWIKVSTSRHVTFSNGNGYGYLWWWMPGQYEAVGRGGQRINVAPDKNGFSVLTGCGYEPGDIGSFIGSAIKSDKPLPENPGAYERLKEKIEDAVKPPKPSPLKPLPGEPRPRVRAT